MAHPVIILISIRSRGKSEAEPPGLGTTLFCRFFLLLIKKENMPEF